MNLEDKTTSFIEGLLVMMLCGMGIIYFLQGDSIEGLLAFIAICLLHIKKVIQEIKSNEKR